MIIMNKEREREREEEEEKRIRVNVPLSQPRAKTTKPLRELVSFVFACPFFLEQIKWIKSFVLEEGNSE
ncbi:MAG: hypothetical protein Q8P67_10055 [archaeon]|nr:hypothetical protein [archaeon]